LLPAVLGDDGKGRAPTPDDVRAIKEFIVAQRTETTPFDIVMEGETPGDAREQAAAVVRPWANAGVTWWIEATWSAPRTDEELAAVRA
jgi:hypothetical protein